MKEKKSRKAAGGASGAPGEKLTIFSALDMTLRDAPERRVSFLLWHPSRPLLLAIAQDYGSVYVLEQHQSTNWPGPMYPTGFEVSVHAGSGSVLSRPAEAEKHKE